MILTSLKTALTAGAAALVFTAGTLGQGEPLGEPAPEAADPALWVVSDADSTVYLFGTVHILPPGLDWHTDAIRTAFNEAGTLYLEADAFGPQAQATMQALIPQVGFLPAGQTLTSMMSDEALSHLDQIAARLGAPAEAIRAGIDPMMPWLAGLQLAVAQMQAAGYDPASGADQALHAEAQADGKSFGYFETAEEQIGFLSGLPLETQLADFETGLEQAIENPDMFDDLVAAWARGDMDRIDRIMNEDMREASADLYQIVIVQRNENWIPQILDILAGEGTVFVAVGAGHMPGESGVINLLREEGFEVTRR